MNTQTQTTTTWNIDPAHSQAEFTVKHMMITKVRGRFSGLEGAIHLDQDDPRNSAVDVTIDAASIDTRSDDRDAHLRSGEFLDAEKYPELTFRSTSIEGARLEPGTEFQVHGELTIRGVTKEVTLDAVYEGSGTDPWGGERVSFSADTTIDRREFGLEWNQTLETGGVLVGNKVNIHLEAQAVQAESQES
ncbi:MAG: YceI family protein [Gemmatimonadota bacterium]